MKLTKVTTSNGQENRKTVFLSVLFFLPSWFAASRRNYSSSLDRNETPATVGLDPATLWKCVLSRHFNSVDVHLRHKIKATILLPFRQITSASTAKTMDFLFLGKNSAKGVSEAVSEVCQPDTALEKQELRSSLQQKKKMSKRLDRNIARR